jgi:hypothetical protein
MPIFVSTDLRKFMKRLILILLGINSIVLAQTPTWSDKIAKIIYNNCTECHHSGGIAPFKLETYSDAQAYAMSIRSATQVRRMPPWHADPSFRHFKGERTLTQQEIDDINSWVNNGAPAGNLANAPTAPVFKDGIKMPSPDLSIKIPTYTVGANTDVYRCFVIPSGLLTDRFISQIEFEPENKAIVHHILLFQDQAQTCKTLDNNDPLPGYSSSGGGIGSNTATLMGGWVPGGGIIDIPPGMGIRVKANSYFILQIHYAPGSQSKTDSTKCHFKFSGLASPREVFVAPILNHINGGNGGLTNGPLYIPANTTKTFNQLYTLPFNFNASLITVAPHMHLIGRTYTVYSVSGTDTTKLIRIPDWDFHWQGGYTFQKIIKLPSGAKVYGIATYDNTTNNMWNPNNPPINVTLGEKTEDEMMLCYFSYTAYQAGDENIILDSTLLSSGVNSKNIESDLNLYPNPANDKVVLKLNQGNCRITVLTPEGKILTEMDGVNGANELNTASIANGIYWILISSDNTSFPLIRKPLIIAR